MNVRFDVVRQLVAKHGAAADAVIVAGLFLVGVSVGSFASRQYLGQPSFYQGEFGPAVMVASGRGFVNPVVKPDSPLSEFLALKRVALDPADVAAVEVQPLDQFQYGTRYLMTALGYAWRISGISWASASTLGAPLCALTIVACYVLCRLWVIRSVAVLGALLIGLSPTHLEQLTHLRDYSKAPFVLWATVLAACVAARSFSRWPLVLLSAACGAVVGIGLGFKMDVVIMAPVFLASLLVFHEARPWTRLGDKLLAASAFVIALTLAAAPVLVRLSSGGTNGYHVILLGYSDQFDDTLGVNRSTYSILPFYSDSYVNAVIQSRNTTGQYLPVPSPQYDAAGRAYWLTIVRHFPADALTRTLAAARGILDLPFNQPAMNFLSVSPEATLWNVLAEQRSDRVRLGALYEWLVGLHGWGVLFGVVLIGAAGANSARLAVFSGSMLLAVSGYLSLQFDKRHYFHLEVIPVLGLLVTMSMIVNAVGHPPAWRVVRRFAASMLLFVLALGTSVGVVRAYQGTHLRRLFQQYVDSPKESVQPVFTEAGGGIWRANWNPTPQRLLPGALRTDYYVVEFDTPPTEMSVVGVRYKAAPAAQNFGRVVAMSESTGVNRVFIPVYSQLPLFEMDGFEFTAGMKDRLRGIYRVSHPEELALLLDLRLSGAWQAGPLAQTLRFDGDGLPDRIQVLGDSIARASPLEVIARIESSDARPNPSDVKEAHQNVRRISRDGIEVDGPAQAQSSYLLSFKPVRIEAPAALLVQGHLDSGGLVFGLLEDNRWYAQLGTGLPGAFVGVIDIKKSGTYVPIVTNATAHDRDRNRFVLSRFGIVTTTPAQP